MVTKQQPNICHGAHIFSYSLGKTQQKATLDIWKVLEMFWGRERKDQLLELIFGPHDSVTSNSKTQINALYNMITLSPDAHSNWGLGTFTLEPLLAEANPYHLRAKFEWTPEKSKSPEELGIAADPTSVKPIPPITEWRLLSFETALPITDGHIVTFTTTDLVNAPVPHPDLLMLQCFLIRVLRMAGRVGEDILETFDSDDEVSSVAAGNAGSSEEQRVHELVWSRPFHNRTTGLETSPPAPPLDLVSNGAAAVEQSSQKKRWRLFSNTRLRRFLSYLHRKIGHNQTTRVSSGEVANSQRKTQRGKSILTLP